MNKENEINKILNSNMPKMMIKIIIDDFKKMTNKEFKSYLKEKDEIPTLLDDSEQWELDEAIGQELTKFDKKEDLKKAS